MPRPRSSSRCLAWARCSARRTPGPATVRTLRRQLRLGTVRGDLPQPATRRRRARRRPPQPGTRINPATPARQHPRPTGPSATPTDAAPTHPLALGRTLAHVVAQHHQPQPSAIRTSLTILTSPRGFSSHRTPCRRTSPTSTPNSACRRAYNSPTKRPATPDPTRTSVFVADV